MVPIWQWIFFLLLLLLFTPTIQTKKKILYTFKYIGTAGDPFNVRQSLFQKLTTLMKIFLLNTF